MTDISGHGAESRPTEDHAILHRRARLGVIILSARTVLQELIVLFGNVYLARVLGPGRFGEFWIVQFALSFFALFGDAGFGAALIQKKDTASDEELSSVFWAQMLLGAAVVLIVFASAPLVVRFWPGLPESGTWMLRALAFNLILTSCRVAPAILLERELSFTRLSIVDLVLTASFYGCASVLAHLGYGSFALVTAVLVQGACGLLAIAMLKPWVPALRLNFGLLRPILRFGLTFQTKHVIGFVNAAVMPLYAGTALGPYALGLVSWSRNTAFFPLTIIDPLARVNFPLLSRLQHDQKAFAATLERTLHVGAAITFLFIALFLGLGPALVSVIYGQQWVPALPTLYVFALAIAVGFVVPIANGALDAVGKPEIMMRLGIYWTILNWVAVTAAMHFRSSALSFTLGYSLHIFVGNLPVLFVVKRLFPSVRLWSRMRAVLVACAGVVAFARMVLLPRANGPVTLSIAVMVEVALFAGVLWVIDRGAIVELVAMVKHKASPNE